MRAVPHAVLSKHSLYHKFDVEGTWSGSTLNASTEVALAQGLPKTRASQQSYRSASPFCGTRRTGPLVVRQCSCAAAKSPQRQCSCAAAKSPSNVELLNGGHEKGPSSRIVFTRDGSDRLHKTRRDVAGLPLVKQQYCFTPCGTVCQRTMVV